MNKSVNFAGPPRLAGRDEKLTAGYPDYLTFKHSAVFGRGL